MARKVKEKADYRIVKIDNDFNKLNLSKFNASQQNFLFELIWRISGKGHSVITFTVEDIFKMVKGSYVNSGSRIHHVSNQEVTELIVQVKKNFFKVDFSVLLEHNHKNSTSNEDHKDENNGENKEDKSLYVDRTVNLFQQLDIVYEDKEMTRFKELTIQVSERFEYLLNRLTGNFTRFELGEFLLLRSKYAKTLFRLLKQYRTTGWAQWRWSEFKTLMGIPAKMSSGAIDKDIIQRAVRELSWNGGQLDLLDEPDHKAPRPIFRNLDYEKIKEGKSHRIKYIKFTFSRDFTTQEKEDLQGAATPLEQLAMDYHSEREFYAEKYYVPYDPNTFVKEMNAAVKASRKKKTTAKDKTKDNVQDIVQNSSNVAVEVQPADHFEQDSVGVSEPVKNYIKNTKSVENLRKLLLIKGNFNLTEKDIEFIHLEILKREMGVQ